MIHWADSLWMQRASRDAPDISSGSSLALNDSIFGVLFENSYPSAPIIQSLSSQRLIEYVLASILIRRLLSRRVRTLFLWGWRHNRLGLLEIQRPVLKVLTLSVGTRALRTDIVLRFRRKYWLNHSHLTPSTADHNDLDLDQAKCRCDPG